LSRINPSATGGSTYIVVQYLCGTAPAGVTHTTCTWNKAAAGGPSSWVAAFTSADCSNGVPTGSCATRPAVMTVPAANGIDEDWNMQTLGRVTYWCAGCTTQNPAITVHYICNASSPSSRSIGPYQLTACQVFPPLVSCSRFTAVLHTPLLCIHRFLRLLSPSMDGATTRSRPVSVAECPCPQATVSLG
jgi:hypothetical protein